MKRILTLTTAGIGCTFLAGCPDDRALPPPEQRVDERPLTEDARLEEQRPADQAPVPGQTTPVPEPQTPVQPERELEDAIRRPDRDLPESDQPEN